MVSFVQTDVKETTISIKDFKQGPPGIMQCQSMLNESEATLAKVVE
jgi:hypothetical protein